MGTSLHHNLPNMFSSLCQTSYIQTTSIQQYSSPFFRYKLYILSWQVRILSCVQLLYYHVLCHVYAPPYLIVLASCKFPACICTMWKNAKYHSNAKRIWPKQCDLWHNKTNDDRHFSAVSSYTSISSYCTALQLKQSKMSLQVQVRIAEFQL